MRIPLVSATAFLASAAVGLLAGCSGSGPSSSVSSLPGTMNSSTQSRVHSSFGRDGSGVAPQYLQFVHFGHTAARAATGTPPGDVAVTDFSTNNIEVLNSSYQLEQTITDGGGPDGDWYDALENLYVANYSAVSVTQYKHDATTPDFTYTSGLSDPINVRTDAKGNVYVADYGFGSASVVVEYPPMTNTPSNSCNTGLANEGLAIDKAGNVFVSGNNSAGSANIVEYKGGLSGCHATTLPPTLSFSGGMTIDKHGTLIVEDQTNHAVDLIKKPYHSISGTCGSGYSDPFHVAINGPQNLLFVADLGTATVDVLNYPACTLNTTLTSANGFTSPAGVAVTIKKQ